MGLYCDKDCNSECRRWIKGEKEESTRKGNRKQFKFFGDREGSWPCLTLPGAFGSFGGTKTTSTSKAISC
jgi:hypothetical protein